MDLNRPLREAKLIASSALMLALWLGTSRLVAQQAASDTSANTKPTAASKQAESQARAIRVLSYNIHHAEGVDGRLDLERIAKIIKSVQPDVVALQEVDSRVKRSQKVDQPQELARLTGMKVVFGGNIDLQGGKYGNALLTRVECQSSENRALPNIDQGEQRGLIDAIVKHDGESVRVLATHFDHRRDPRERMASIELVNQLVAGQVDMPSLLVGDLNAEFSSDELDQARKLWKVSSTERMPTIPVGKPERQIDFVLCYPPARWQVEEVKVLDESTASDHRPILAVLTLLGESKR